jgi:uncharacterized protein YdhG (YjbR/CyaY superfamily)
MPKKVPAFDACLAAFGDEQRHALEKLRKLIHSIVPEAEECVSYGLAAFRLDGQPIAGLGAGADLCAFYPMSGSIVGRFQKELADYKTSKGAIHFAPEKPLPAGLVRKLVKARIAESKGK